MEKFKLSGKYKKIMKQVERELSCSAHDLDHVIRVYKMAVRIAKEEKNVDLDVLKSAVLLHDIARVKEDKDKTGKICHAVESARMSEEILASLNYSKNKIEKIKKCILAHRYKTECKAETIEEKILFDADKLDSLGAIVIMRAGMWLGRNNANIFPKMTLEKYIKENLVEGKINGRIKDNSKHCIYYEHEIKNKKLPGVMHTKTGKKIAKERLKFLDMFLDRLRKEAEGIL
jgi:uncharacterized protein